MTTEAVFQEPGFAHVLLLIKKRRQMDGDTKKEDLTEEVEAAIEKIQRK